jgi:hypothetical protein
MPGKIYKMKAEVQLYPTENAAWHLLYLPHKEAQSIRQKFKPKEKGWSSLPVDAYLGKTKWQTSIFFDKRSQSYILPLKAEVRKKEILIPGDKVEFSIAIRL